MDPLPVAKNGLGSLSLEKMQAVKKDDTHGKIKTECDDTENDADHDDNPFKGWNQHIVLNRASTEPQRKHKSMTRNIKLQVEISQDVRLEFGSPGQIEKIAI